MKKIKRKIRRKRGSGPRNMYFTMDTQEHIVQYQNAEDPEERKAIYIKGIQPAFDKLVENLIFVYGFKSPYDSFNDLKTDCVSKTPYFSFSGLLETDAHKKKPSGIF